MVTQMFDFDIVQCGFLILFLMVTGEIISHKLKALLPSILVSALLFLGLTWTGILPKNLVQTSGLTTLTTIAMMFVVIGMGVSINLRELKSNWKVVVIASISYIGQTGLLILLMTLLFDHNIAIGSVPGGAAVALMVQEKARSLGFDHIIVQSVLLVAVQSMAACPFASWMIRKEIQRIRKNPSNTAFPVSDFKTDTPKRIWPEQSAYRSLFRFYLVAWIAARLELITGLSRYVFCLILGILLGHFELLPRDEMKRSNSQGFLHVMMMTMILNGFSTATPAMFAELMLPILCVLAISILGIFLFSTLCGRFLKLSIPMSFALGLNGMIGFPLNMMLSQDIIDYMTEDPDEKDMLNRQISSRMVIAGFTSVTFLATVGAALLINFMG